MENAKTYDLTTGEPNKVLVRFCLPLFGSVIFQQLYNISDSLIAGKFISKNALAAVGNSYELTLIFIAIAFGLNIGCSVITSGFFGAKELSKVKTTVYTTFISCGVLCLILMALGFILCAPMLELINTPSEIMEDSALYLRIYILGLPFLFFYNVATGIFSAFGDSKTPFIFLAASSTSNIVVDYIFVKHLNMAVAGVAWATFLCQGVSCILAVSVILIRLSKIVTTEKTTFFSLAILKKISVVAIPSMLQQSFISIGNIIIQGVINGFGTDVIAGYAAAIKLNNLVITSFTTLGNGVSNYTAQNLGAKKPERISKGFFAGIKLVWTICIPFIILYAIFGRYLVDFFIDGDSNNAISEGMTFLRIVAPFYLVVSAKLITDGVLRGATLMKQFMIATFTDLILRVVLVFILSSIWGSVGIWLSWPIGWIVGTGLSLWFYARRR